MNILFFLTPKSNVSYVYNDNTIGEALDAIRQSGYTSLPVITRSGKYIGTVTEGDFLWNYIDDFRNVPPEESQKFPLARLKRRFQNAAVNVNADLNDLLNSVYAQNFVPIIDDRGIFIGIVTRQEIMKHYCACHS